MASFLPTSAKLVGHPLAAVGAITDIDTSQRNPLGLRIWDDAGGCYIYLSGVANTLQGSWVTFDEAFTTALLTANAVGLVAIAMAAIVATDFGWYCVVSPLSGVTGNCDVVAADAAVYIDGTDGRVDDAVVAGDLVLNAYSRSADGTPAANQATFQIFNPSVNNILG